MEERFEGASMMVNTLELNLPSIGVERALDLRVIECPGTEGYDVVEVSAEPIWRGMGFGAGKNLDMRVKETVLNLDCKGLEVSREVVVPEVWSGAVLNQIEVTASKAGADGGEEGKISCAGAAGSLMESLVLSPPAGSAHVMEALKQLASDGGDSVMDMVKSWPRAGVYARVSTQAQEDDGTSLDTQVEGGVIGALKDGYQVVDESIWRDVASGVSTVRPGLTKMMEAIERGEVELVYIYDPDRLAREALLVLNLCEQVEAAGGAVRFVYGPSVDTDEGKLLAYLLGYAAGVERKKIAERTMRAKRRVAENGRMPVGVGGGGIFGYDYDPVTKKRTINEAEAAIVRLMFEWYASGWTSHAIAKELNDRGVPTKRGKLWHPRTVEYILRHTSYIGVDYFGKNRCRIVYEKRYTREEKKKIIVTPRPESDWVRIEGDSPRIVSDELHAKVQRRFAMPRPRRTQKHFYFLTGFIRCKVCGSPICGGSQYRGVRRYRCRGTAATSTRGKICNAPYIDADLFEETVLEGVKAALRDPDVVLSELEEFLKGGEGDISDEVTDLKKKIEECRKKESRLLGLFGEGQIDQDLLMKQVGPVKVYREECERTLARIESQRETALNADEVRELVRERCRELADGLDDLDYDGKCALMHALDVQAVAVRGEVEIWIVVSGKCTTTEHTSA